MSNDLQYLKLLARQYPNVEAASAEIANLSAIINLPKGTEHFLADIHGEHEAFDHVIRNASGVVKRKIDDAFGDRLTQDVKNELATLVYYPQEKLAMVKTNKTEEEQLQWLESRMLYLIILCRQAAYKYSRSKVRKAIPRHFQYIIEELLHENEESGMKRGYYKGIVASLLEIGRAEAFIVTIADLIRDLVVDHLHIIGDVFDRGPGAHHVMETLKQHHSVDMQWGNHDALWIGAACGSDVCIADALRISLRYGNLETLQEGYGLNLAPLVRFAMEKYQCGYASTFQVKAKQSHLREKDLTLLSRMQKAIANIQFKLEGQLAERRPEFGLGHRRLLHRIDWNEGIVEIDDQRYPLLDREFPTLDKEHPYDLTADEQDVLDKLRTSFLHSSTLQRDVRFLIDKGGMYKVFNGNLLYHGCIPMEPEGEFASFRLKGKNLSGKALLDGFDEMVRKAYYSREQEEKSLALDVVWYLWCGSCSPLFGKSRMSTFERYFLEEKETHKEIKNPYYIYREQEGTCLRILEEFGLHGQGCHIINGHVPVKVTAGEVPIKAGGRLITIDGGFSKAYQKETGIAGYTLIFNSQGMNLVAHEPFESKEKAIRDNLDMVPTNVFIETGRPQMLVGDTDPGVGLKEDIVMLKKLLQAYRDGVLKERNG
jgi:fructose-1,6-bisphosphatase-3